MMMASPFCIIPPYTQTINDSSCMLYGHIAGRCAL